MSTDTDTLDGAGLPPGLATSSHLRRVEDKLGALREEVVHHVADVKVAHEGQSRDLAEVRQHMAAGATAQIERTAIEQARRREEAQRSKEEAARRDAEAAAQAAWWGRVSEFFERITANWLVRLVVLGLLVALFPSLQRYADRAIGSVPEVTAPVAP